MANATSGWIPTITVSAPRSRVIMAIPRSERETKESMTSSDVTSTMIPRDRWRVTCAITSSRSCSTSVSVSADWIDAIRNGPCLRIGTATSASDREIGDPSRSREGAPSRSVFGLLERLPGDDGVAQQSLGLLDAALEVADRVDLRQVHAERDERLRDLRGEAGD